MDNYAIIVDRLSKSFKKLKAVNSISFNVPKGQFVGVLGANGAGKTTTIAMLLGLLLPDSGKIKIFGQDIHLSRYAVLGRMNFSSPYVDLPKRLTVEENLKVYAKLYGVNDPSAQIQKLSDELDLTGLLKKLYGSLSAGQKTRVMLAKALINQPELLLLDEPTASLDPDVADRIRVILQQYVMENNSTVLMASHNMQEIEQLCSNIILMDRGNIVAEGSPKNLLTRFAKNSMEEVFLHIARSPVL